MKISGYTKTALTASFLAVVTLTALTGCFPKKPEATDQATTPTPQEEVKAEKVEEIAAYPVNNVEEIVSKANVETDAQVSSDGAGSVKISVLEPTTINLFEAGDVDVEKAKLLYQAKLKSENLEGNAYLEMLLHYPDTGDFYVQGKEAGITGTSDWTTVEASTEVEDGKNPDAVKLNLVVDGKGTVWVDDVKLSKVVTEQAQPEASSQTTTTETEQPGTEPAQEPAAQ